MHVVVIDGQGGGVGKALVTAIKTSCPSQNLLAVGTNSIATSTMLKAGADEAATGENAILTASRKADVIIGPIGIVIADSLCGEISPAMATAIGQSDATRILLPVGGHCDNIVVGAQALNLKTIVHQAVVLLQEILQSATV
jgi:hypothetical protein